MQKNKMEICAVRAQPTHSMLGFFKFTSEKLSINTFLQV